ncbi:TPA: DNA adenine methylase [Staphylococcus pseudintermedius]|nr:DNA adenine methylase [Staphylococcus pseudintermedius]
MSAINYTEKLIELIEKTEVNIENWYKMKKIQESKHSLDLEIEENIISLGFSTFFLNRTNRSGIIKAGVIGGKAQNGTYLMDCRFNKVNLIQRIKEISKYRNRILIYNKDAEEFIKIDLSKTKGCFVFIDPPYINKGYQLYTNFYNEDDHVNLAKSIKKYLDKKDWILTYDIDELLEDLYSEYESENYYINYSVHNPRKGVEKIIFSKNLKRNKYSDFIKLAKI